MPSPRSEPARRRAAVAAVAASLDAGARATWAKARQFEATADDPDMSPDAADKLRGIAARLMARAILLDQRAARLRRFGRALPRPATPPMEETA